MNDVMISRVNYFDRQFLRRQDFADEQQYHLAMRRRHNIAHHGWGIVSGLTLDFDNGALFLNPGMAIDGYGRELIQSYRVELPSNTFVSEMNDAVDVWLLYELLPSDPAQVGFDSTPEDGQTDYYRLQEAPRVLLTRAGFLPADARKPPQVPLGDYDFAAYRTPIDDPDQSWPVFLGNVRWAKAEEPPIVSMDGRPLIRAVGEQLVAPSGSAAVQLGSSTADGGSKFSVHIPAPEPAAEKIKPWLELVERPLNPAAEADTPPPPRQMDLVVRGQAVFHEDVHLAAGKLIFQGAQSQIDQKSAFRLYRFSQRTSVNQDASDAPVELVENQLRVEIGQEGQSEGQFVVGTWSDETEVFEPCLTIDAHKNMTVHGNLVVEGRVIEKTVRSKAGLSQDARNLAQVAALTGMAGSSQLLGNVYRSPFTAQTKEASEILASPEELETFVTALLKDAKEAQPFFDVLMTKESGKATVVNEATEKATAAVLSRLVSAHANALVQAAVDNQAAKLIDALIQSEKDKDNLVRKVVDGLTTDVVNAVLKNQQAAVLKRLVDKSPVAVINQVIAKDLNKVIDKAIIANAAKVIEKIVASNTGDVIADVVSRAEDDVIAKLLEVNAEAMVAAVIEDQQTAVIESLVDSKATTLANALWDGQVTAVVDSLKAEDSRIASLVSELKKPAHVNLREALLAGLLEDEEPAPEDEGPAPEDGEDLPPTEEGGADPAASDPGDGT